MAVKQQVRQFYDQVGWQEGDDGNYQNAQYEDLRPVSQEYIHRCHLRVLRHLKPGGRFLLDAGSGPIQYPEYLEYSRSYQRRVCVDISFVALLEARKKIGDHGLFVVADVANLPFISDGFDGIVSLHTIHHLPIEEQALAYVGFHRVLAQKSSAVVVNGWKHPPLAGLMDRLTHIALRLKGSQQTEAAVSGAQVEQTSPLASSQPESRNPQGTFVQKTDAAWLRKEAGSRLPSGSLEIWVWRSASVRFLRAVVQPEWGGRWLLRLLFWLEERFPHYFGENGQYPLVVIKK